MTFFAIADTTEVDKMIENVIERTEPAVIGYWMVNGPVTDFFRQRSEQRFAAEGDDAVGVWAQLRESTQNLREWLRDTHGYDIEPATPINQRTGQLREYASFSDAGGESSGTGYRYLYPNYLPAGELGDKLRTAQRGRTEPGTVPRPVLGVSFFDLDSVQNMIVGFIENGAD